MTADWLADAVEIAEVSKDQSIEFERAGRNRNGGDARLSLVAGNRQRREKLQHTRQRCDLQHKREPELISRHDTDP